MFALLSNGLIWAVPSSSRWLVLCLGQQRAQNTTTWYSIIVYGGCAGFIATFPVRCVDGAQPFTSAIRDDTCRVSMQDRIQ
ncbi:hypothetical protein BGY98DRAFT_944883 [Russula aff. rugulosa BPL654]|nr:hypothetical protein BGY98DRAFT_944883 [Russula aff. rugulosa BPL654]